jgi:monofunctional glycosyltransferase
MAFAKTQYGLVMSKFKLFFYLFLLGGLIDVGRYFIYPNVSDLKEMNPIPTAFMEYRQEEWTQQNRDMEITQKWVPMSQISPNIIKAVLIGEDDKFWKHDGFDVKGMEQALERSLKKGKMAGGSTISQQLAKNLYLSPSKNPVRKVKEAVLTWRIEKTLSKRRILEIYLNVAEWGDGIFGIEAAAHHYYHKSAKNLNGLEAAHLATVLPNPILYNAIGNQKYVQNRSRIIYKIMKRRGIVIPHYQEVVSSKTKEKNDNVSDNISDLFSDNTNLVEESIPADPTIHTPTVNEENTSLTF